MSKSSSKFSLFKLALLTTHLIWNGCLSLPDLCEILRGGKCYPLFLYILSAVAKMADEKFQPSGLDVNVHDLFSKYVDFSKRLTSDTSDKCYNLFMQLFKSSGYTLNQMMPEGQQSNDFLLSALEERNLTFLAPNLRLTSDLMRLILSKTEDNEIVTSEDERDMKAATSFATYLNTYTTEDYRQSSEFVHICFPIVYEYMYQVGVIKMGLNASPNELMARERTVWHRLIPVHLASVLHHNSERQLDALHALQIFWTNKGMPKGFLLRCFMNLYDCELIVENTFFDWKEEINQNFPSKGQALFEVNRWLTWLETAEEEDEEDEQPKLDDVTNVTEVVSNVQ